MSEGQIRPLEFGELLDQSFSFYRNHFALLFTISVVPGLVLSPFAILIRQPYGWVPSGMSALWPFLLKIYGWILLNSLIGFYSVAASVFAVSEIYLGRDVTLQQAYAQIGEFWGRLLNLWMSVLIRIIGVSCTLLLIPLVPLMFLWWAFSLPILLFERLPVGKALKRSRVMTKGIRGKIFLTFLLMMLIVYTMSFVVTAPILFLQKAIVGKGQLGPIWLTLLSAILGAVGGAVASPPLMVAITMLYYNTRMVQEGFDLQLLLERLGPAAPERLA